MGRTTLSPSILFNHCTYVSLGGGGRGREKNIAYIIASTLFMGFMAEDFSATHFRQNTRGPGEEKDESESH